MCVARRGRYLRVGLILASTCFLYSSATAFAQGDDRPCRVAPAENGLIRGDQVPRGCVLVPESASPEADVTGRHPFVLTGEALFFVPNAKGVVLRNGQVISGGRPLVPAVPANAPGRDRAERRSGFGPLERNLGPRPSDRHFGPLERNFGGRPPAQRSPPQARDGV